VRFRSRTVVQADRFQQVPGATVVQQEQTIAQTPERSRAPVLTLRVALCNAIVERLPHAMNRKIAEQIHGLREQCAGGGGAAGERRRVTERAPRLVENRGLARSSRWTLPVAAGPDSA